MWQRAIWLFISCCIALALWNGFIGSDPSTAYERLQHKSEDVRKDAEKLGKKIDTGLSNAPGSKNANPDGKGSKGNQ